MGNEFGHPGECQKAFSRACQKGLEESVAICEYLSPDHSLGDFHIVRVVRSSVFVRVFVLSFASSCVQSGSTSRAWDFTTPAGKFIPGNGGSYHLCRRSFDLVSHADGPG